MFSSKDSYTSLERSLAMLVAVVPGILKSTQLHIDDGGLGRPLSSFHVKPTETIQAIGCFADPQKRREYFRLYSDDIILHGYQGVGPGLESVKQFYNAFWRVFPDAQVIVQELVEDAGTLVVRYVIIGTQHDAFMGVASSGQRIELPGISVLHFREGQCFERWTCSDSLLLLNQIQVS